MCVRLSVSDTLLFVCYMAAAPLGPADRPLYDYKGTLLVLILIPLHFIRDVVLPLLTRLHFTALNGVCLTGAVCLCGVANACTHVDSGGTNVRKSSHPLTPGYFMPGQPLLQLSCYLSTVCSDVFVGHVCQIESLRMLLRSGQRQV